MYGTCPELQIRVGHVRCQRGPDKNHFEKINYGENDRDNEENGGENDDNCNDWPVGLGGFKQK